MRLISKIGLHVGVGALAGAAAALRLVALPPLLPDLDSVNFSRSLSSYDLAAQAPHFPGYPVFVVMARVFANLGLPEVAALAAPGVLLGAVAAAALTIALRRHVGTAAAFAGGAVVAFSPLAVLTGATPTSDGAGFAALALAVAAVLALLPSQGDKRMAAGAGVIAGLSLGIRASFLPALVLLPIALRKEQRLPWIAGAVAGTVLWLLPLALVVGPAQLVEIGSHFLNGHANEWGGTVVVQPDLALRLSQLGFDLGAAGLALPWAGAWSPLRFAVAGLLVAGAVALARAWRDQDGVKAVAGLALLVLVPYGAWAFVGQNLAKARHALPLVLACALLAAAFAAAARRLAPAYAGLVALLLICVTTPLARAQGREASPAARLVQHVAGSIAPTSAMVFTGEEARLFERYAPQYRTGRLPGADDLVRQTERLAAAGIQVYVTSEAPGAGRLSSQLEPVAHFACDRLVRSHSDDLVLYRYRPALAAAPEAHP